MAVKWYRKLDSDWTDSMWNSTMNSTSNVSYADWIMGNATLVGNDSSYLRNDWANNANVFVSNTWSALFCMANKTSTWLSTWTNGSSWLYVLTWWSWELIYFVLSAWDWWSQNPWWVLTCFCADGTSQWTPATYTVDWVLEISKRYHIWFNWKDDKSIQIWINWTKVWTPWTSTLAPTSFSSYSNNHSIGSLRNSMNKDRDGKIDDMKHYNTALANWYIKNDYAYYKGFI